MEEDGTLEACGAVQACAAGGWRIPRRGEGFRGKVDAAATVVG